MVPVICQLAVAAALTLTPISAQPQRNTVDWYDWKLQVSERVLDGTIACDIDRTRSVNKEEFPRLSETQKKVALDKAAFDKKRARNAVSTSCKNSSRVKAANGFTECELELRMKRTIETASGSVVR